MTGLGAPKPWKSKRWDPSNEEREKKWGRSGLDHTPASFQGNRDESTNVDMSLAQRDAQVSVMAKPLDFLKQGVPRFLAS